MLLTFKHIMIRNQDVGMLVIEFDFLFIFIYDKEIQDKHLFQ